MSHIPQHYLHSNYALHKIAEIELIHLSQQLKVIFFHIILYQLCVTTTTVFKEFTGFFKRLDIWIQQKATPFWDIGWAHQSVYGNSCIHCDDLKMHRSISQDLTYSSFFIWCWRISDLQVLTSWTNINKNQMRSLNFDWNW